MKFYCIQERRPVNVPEKDVKYRMTKNGRRQAVANYNGIKLYKFVKNDD